MKENSWTENRPHDMDTLLPLFEGGAFFSAELQTTNSRSQTGLLCTWTAGICIFVSHPSGKGH